MGINNQKKIAIVGQLGNPLTGLGKALNDFNNYAVEHLGSNNVKSIDIIDNKRFFLSIFKILSAESDVFYFTPAGSLGGHLRDLIYLFCMIIRSKEIVLHFHNSNFGNVINHHPFLVKINRWVFRHVKKIIILGNKHKEMFSKLDVNDLQFEIVSNGIDEFLFINEEEFSKKTGKNIIYFSNMIESKGYKKVLEASKHLTDKGYRFIFSGKFFEERAEDEFLKEIKGLSHIEYINGVYGEDKKSLLHQMDIFILPSEYKDETLPISMLEAMASGLYIITTPRGVIAEAVNPKTSFILESVDANSIVTAIENVPNNLEYHDFNLRQLYQSNGQTKMLTKLLSTVID